MEPEGSLPCSQEPSTGPYPEPDRFNLFNTFILLKGTDISFWHVLISLQPAEISSWCKKRLFVITGGVASSTVAVM
jgi:hypothetical protein